MIDGMGGLSAPSEKKSQASPKIPIACSPHVNPHGNLALLSKHEFSSSTHTRQSFVMERAILASVFMNDINIFFACGKRALKV